MMTPEAENVQCVAVVDAMQREHRRILQTPGTAPSERLPAGAGGSLRCFGRQVASVAWRRQPKTPSPDEVAACETPSDDVAKPQGNQIDSVPAAYL